MKMHFNVYVEMPDTSERYMDACAKIRKISTSRLVTRLIQRACDEQLVLAVLDDNSRAVKRLPGEESSSRYRPRRSKSE